MDTFLNLFGATQVCGWLQLLNYLEPPNYLSYLPPIDPINKPIIEPTNQLSKQPINRQSIGSKLMQTIP